MTSMTKARKLRTVLHDPRLTLIVEAHNGLSARIAEAAGFQALWGSSLSLSASMAARDCNEMSWSQIVDILQFIDDATSIPLLLDGDTGYGNFNNVRYVIRRLEKAGVAGVCLEDKLFPKTNSLLESGRQPLARIDEFAGKIKAAKDTQRDPNFCVVARVEAFIAGWGLSEAIRRADAYLDE